MSAGRSAPADSPRISLAAIEDAARVIDPVFLDSPRMAAGTLSEVLGVELVLKVETLNPIRSFKGRGASCFVRGLTDATPLVAASAGNFGQGLAYAARARSIPLTIFAAENASPLKIARMRALGAEVRLHGQDFDGAKAAARSHAERHGLRFVEDGREPAISEGAGSIAVELLHQTPRLDAMLIALGNGALINGMGTWIKARSPGTEVIGICARGAPAMERSWRSGRLESTPRVDTIADGIGVRVPVAEALEDMGPLVDDVLLVDDAIIIEAMRLLLLHCGLLIEPAGAVGVAALLAEPGRYAGRRVAAVLCGGNVTERQFAQWFCGARAGGSGPG